MAKQDIIISIQLKGAEGVSKSTDKVANSQKHLREMMSRSAVELEKLNIKKKRQKELNVQIAKSELGYSDAVGKTASQLKASKTQAGLNNAILLESGRLASDASYGFTAMANNLSQLVSLFGSFAKTSGGMTQSLKDLGKSLIGTGGVLLAVQLLIGALQSERVIKFIKALGGLSPRLRELGELSEGFSQATEELVGNFDIYTRKLMDSNESEEQKAIALKKLNKEYPDFNASILTTAKNTDEASDAIERYIKQLKKQALSQAAIQQFQEVSGEQSKELFVLEMRKLELQDDINRDEIEANRILSKITDDMRADQKLAISEQASSYVLRIAQNKKLIEAVEEESTAVATSFKNRLDIIDDFIILADDKEKKGRSIRKKAYKEGDLDFEKERQQSQEREIKSFLQKETAKVNAEFKGIRDRATLKQQEFVEDEGRRLDAFLRSTNDENAKADAIKRSDEAIKKSKDELSSYIVRLNTEQAAKITKVELEATRRTIELDQKKTDTLVAHQDKLAFLDGKYTFDTLQRNIQRLESEISLEEQLALNHKIGTEERAQADLKLANLRRELSSERIALEKQEFDFVREQIEKVAGALEQTLEVTAHNQTVRLEENYAREIAAAEGNSERQQELQQELAKKKDDIQRKQFNVDKAMKVGRALMDTYESSTLAYGSQIIIGDPTSIVRAQVARAIAIATGLANVANIARQKYQSSLGAGGGGGAGAGGGGLQIQAPDFNVVGASQTSQLAQAVTTQQEKPVKAFVVGKDISTQQELDRNITNTASFG